MRENTMTVAELIVELEKCPQDYLVETEGRDCYGDVHSVFVNHEEKSILIKRPQE